MIEAKVVNVTVIREAERSERTDDDDDDGDDGDGDVVEWRRGANKKQNFIIAPRSRGQHTLMSAYCTNVMQFLKPLSNHVSNVIIFIQKLVLDPLKIEKYA